ncbi:helix-turn-helix transcriptional regulator [Halomicroarcula sp. F13]|uniref:Helix-turn-helix transcriptional regulator n=1 Tax=Haloarcula rubra TaxID=2487747 RepID=A0AAW4PNB6_9EURY|nr:helix-turn-helix domain-containing protein [Halomicroarcula rubra]MBX0321719.1 helix-turn-helix transcriptional regulator [Halomicroarcula rubra]
MEGFDCATDDPRCYCLLSDVLDLLGRKYVMDVVCVVAVHGTVRFGTLEDHIPEASTSTLSARLDALEAAGLLTREQYDEIPPRVEYELTDDGAELAERLEPVLEWAQKRATAES